MFTFLDVPQSAWVASNGLAFAVRDGFPVSRGHTLVVPRRLVATWFDAQRDEQHAILDLIDEVKAALDREFSPDGYNIGLNAGAAAGQTVMHLHVHVIPRYFGDTPDPRGGVRGVIAGKQTYDFEAAAPRGSGARDSATGVYRAGFAAPFSALPAFVHGDDSHFELAFRAALRDAERADLLSAFVQPSGVDLLLEDLRDALTRGAQIRFLTGDYQGITSADALRRLLRLAEEHAGFRP